MPPNEVVGTVVERNGRFDAYVELHQINAAEGEVIPASLTTQHTAKEEAAFATACRIYRMLGAQRRMIYSQASDAEFEVLVRVLSGQPLKVIEIAVRSENCQIHLSGKGGTHHIDL